MSPLLGFTIFFGYPLVMTAYYSFTHYDLLSSPKWIGLANYRYLFSGDQIIRPRSRTRLDHRRRGAAERHLRLRRRGHALARAARDRVLPHRLLSARAGPPVAATLGFVYLLNPRACSTSSGFRPALVRLADLVEAVARLLGLWGVGNLMIIFLAAVIDVPRHLYESAELDGAGACSACAGSRCRRSAR